MKKAGFVLFLILGLSFFAHSTTAQTQPTLLFIYSDQQEYNQFASLMEGTNFSIITREIDDASISDISQADMIILSSSQKPDLEDSVETALYNFSSRVGTSLTVITPYLEEFSDDLEETLGVDKFDDVYPEPPEEVATWEITSNQRLGLYSDGAVFNYSGQIAAIQTTKPVIASITNSSLELEEEEDDFQLPLPLIVNASTSEQQIYSMGLSLLDAAEEELIVPYFQTEQLPSVIDLLFELVKTSFSGFFQSYYPQITDTATDATNTNTGSNQQQPGPLTIPDFNLWYVLVGVLVVAILAFFNRVVAITNWIIRKTYGLIFFFVGAYYNVQERSLDYNEVMMNQSRISIIEYLEHVGSYGAHLREIKAITNMGTGSVLWHLQVLEDFNIIEKININDYTVFISSDRFPSFDAQLKQIELQLQSKYTLATLEVLTTTDNSILELHELEEATNISRRTLRRLVKKMERLGLIQLITGRTYMIEIIEKNKLAELYESFYLRHNYDPESDQISISTTE